MFVANTVNIVVAVNGFSEEQLIKIVAVGECAMPKSKTAWSMSLQTAIEPEILKTQGQRGIKDSRA